MQTIFNKFKLSLTSWFLATVVGATLLSAGASRPLALILSLLTMISLILFFIKRNQTKNKFILPPHFAQSNPILNYSLKKEKESVFYSRMIFLEKSHWFYLFEEFLFTKMLSPIKYLALRRLDKYPKEVRRIALYYFIRDLKDEESIINKMIISNTFLKNSNNKLWIEHLIEANNKNLTSQSKSDLRKSGISSFK